MPNHHELATLIWQIADLLRGPYRPPQYERVMLPMTVLRRFDCVLAPTKAKVLAEYAKRKAGKLEGDALDRKLSHAAGQRFHNHSPLDFERLKGDPDNIEKHLVSYIKGFSRNVRDIFEFENEIERMREANILYLVVSKFGEVDLHPSGVPNAQMGLVFENLIRRFNELANETAGDHFTPREVIRLMVNVLFIDDDKLLATPQFAAKVLDLACGTGGMLAEAQSYLREHHAQARLYTYGQDYNKRAFATAASDMLMKEVAHNGTSDNVRFGDSFTEDQFAGETFDYFLTNPPFGVDWKKQQKEIEREHEKLGSAGRFGAGLPRVGGARLKRRCGEAVPGRGSVSWARSSAGRDHRATLPWTGKAPPVGYLTPLCPRGRLDEEQRAARVRRFLLLGISERGVLNGDDAVQQHCRRTPRTADRGLRCGRWVAPSPRVRGQRVCHLVDSAGQRGR